MRKECPDCGGSYKKLGSHISKTDCAYPEFTQRQMKVLKGLMLGDGWIHNQTKIENSKPYFALGMTNHAFLEWFNSLMGVHTTGIKDATESRNSTKPYYRVRTMRTPKLKDLDSWYGESGLNLKQIELTPLSLKMWYVSDGYLHHQDDMVRPRITISNRIVDNRTEFFKKLFSDLPVNPWIGEDKISFSVDDTEFLFDYMGESPKGFEDKWPDGVQDDSQETL